MLAGARPSTSRTGRTPAVPLGDAALLRLGPAKAADASLARSLATHIHRRLGLTVHWRCKGPTSPRRSAAPSAPLGSPHTPADRPLPPAAAHDAATPQSVPAALLDPIDWPLYTSYAAD